MNAPTNLKNLLPATNIQQGTDVVHESAHLHVTGSATYIDDIPEHAGTLYAALILSPVAHGELIGDGIDRDAILKEHGVVAVYTAKDIPGDRMLAAFAGDEPVFATDTVQHIGQVVGLVVADTVMQARRAARKVVLNIEALPAIVDAVGKQIEVHMDGGIRSGQDVLKARALGAKGTYIGRAFLYGLGAMGQPGVEKALQIIHNELDLTMAFCGRTQMDSVDKSILLPGTFPQ